MIRTLWHGGWLEGALGVLIFSGTLVATRLALQDLDPIFVTFARSALAGGVAVAALGTLRPTLPRGRHLLPLLAVAASGAVAFPLLITLALRHIDVSRAAVFIALLPLCTAALGSLIAKEPTSPSFWGFAVAGAGLLAAYAARSSGGGSWVGDAMMVAAVLACGLAFALGGKLTRELGGWQVTAWALLFVLPFTLPAALWAAPAGFGHVSGAALGGLGYIATMSTFVGMAFWYRGLARGGIATVGQLQLLQPIVTVLWSVWLLGEGVEPALVFTALGVIACLAGAQRVQRRKRELPAPLEVCPAGR